MTDLRKGHRAAKIRHGPATLEEHRLVVVDVSHQEDPVAEAGQQLVHRRPVERRAGHRALEAFHHAHLVALGLEPPDDPRAGVGEALVVEVHGVLGGEHAAQPVRARLLKQREHGGLRRRVRARREVAEDLVHVEQRPQAARARLRAHPGEHLVQQDGYEEHALGLGQVRDGQDRDARLALGCVEHPLDVKGLPFHPRREAGRRDQVVERHGQAEAVLRRVERLQVEHADLVERRLLDFADDGGDVQVAAFAPGPVEEVGQQDMLAALDGVGVDAEKAEQARDRGQDTVAEGGGVLRDNFRRRGEGAQDLEGASGRVAGRVDREIGGLLHAPDPLTVLAPLGQALPPGLRRTRRIIVGRHPFAGGLTLVHPRPEIGRRERREGQQQVAEVALGIDGDRGHAVDGGLFEQGEAQAGLAAAGHAQDHGVRRQVA